MSSRSDVELARNVRQDAPACRRFTVARGVERVAERDQERPFAQIARVADRQGLELGRFASVVLTRGDDGQVASRVGGDDLGVKFLPVGRANGQLARPFDNMIAS